MLELPLRSWYKLNFNGSVHNNKAGAGLVAQNNIGVLTGAGSFSFVVLSMHETDIRGLWHVLCGLQL